MKEKLNEKEIKKLKELENEIMLCGEIYNDKNWKNYEIFWKLNKKKNG